jgi:hypothetical protein
MWRSPNVRNGPGYVRNGWKADTARDNIFKMSAGEKIDRLVRFFALCGMLVVVVILFYIIPGLHAGRPLAGPPNSNALFRSGGFHCPHDGPYRIHFHTCEGPTYALPTGDKPSDYPTVSR